MGVFSKNNQPETRIKRNAFDGSFQNNLTGKLGYIYPCFCKEVVPGDTFRINAAYGLRFMPTAFPLQTKIKAHLDFFYVRIRNLWDKWNNYYTAVGPHDGFPVLSREEVLKQIQTGQLGDYLGLPSTVVGTEGVSFTLTPIIPRFSSSASQPFYNYYLKVIERGASKSNDYKNSIANLSFGEYPTVKFFSYASLSEIGTRVSSFTLSQLPYVDGVPHSYRKLPFSEFPKVIGDYLQDNNKTPRLHVCFTDARSAFSNAYIQATNGVDVREVLSIHNGDILIDEQTLVSDFGFTTSQPLIMHFYLYDSNEESIVSSVHTIADYGLSENPLYTSDDLTLIISQNDSVQVYEVTDYLNSLPFDISALPFRAYEQIYNSFYRDDRNNPLIVNGEFDPNRFLPNLHGGSDSTPYRLRKRNWEQDFLTTALPSPQFGQAPLVGITRSGVASFTDADGNVISSQLSVDNDGDTVVGFSTTSDSNVNQTLIKLASSGISINDLRGVNSLQRYLETKYRRGLRYRDQIASHFGVDIKQDVLDMPEFIGSITQTVDVSQINQTSATGEDPLGSYAGQLSCVGGRKHGFQKYCDEQGYIIGLLSVVPVPCYSQLMPKHFLKTHEPLDFFFPEFNHLGYQPIKYSEVCPYQSIINGISVNSTFGYQRAWYDYLSNVDEVHGQFRTTLNNFLMSRVFNSVPSLNEEFLTVDPDSLNDVFTVNQVNGEPVDTFLGQIHFDVTMMRPIARFGVPRLE